MPDTRITPSPRAEVASIPTLPPQAYKVEPEDSIALGSNENRFGVSPKVIAALSDHAAHRVNFYPAIEARPLNALLAEVHGLEPDWVASGAGGETLLPLVLSAFLEPGAEVAYFRDGFVKFRNYMLMAGARPVPVQRDGDAVAQMLAAITPRTRIVMFDNPGNPTGRMLSQEDVRRIHQALPGDVLLVLDEAYIEFADCTDIGMSLIREAGNVMVARTLSKAYGLAGLRVGWVAAQPVLMDTLRRLLPTYPISRPSLLGAMAAVADQDHLAHVTARLRQNREAALARFRAAGWHVPPSQGNFLLLRTPEPADIVQAHEALTRNGIVVRFLPDVEGAPAIRMTIGTDEDMAAVFAALEI